MSRRQNRAQSRRDLWLSTYGSDNRVRRCQRWINLCAQCDRAIRFGGTIEQFFWKLHRPGNVCDAAIKFSIDEIGAAAKKQTKRRSHDKIVSQVHPRNFMSMRVVKSEEQQSDHPAVARHSAFPNSQDRQRLPQHFGFIEKNVTEPSPDNDSEKRRASNKVSDFCYGQIGEPAFGQPEEKDVAGDKREHIRQAVPTRADVIVNPKDN